MHTHHKRTWIRVVASAVAIVAMQAAHADNKLFPTDVLNPGQIDAFATLSGSQLSNDFTYTVNGNTATTKQYSSNLGANVRYGLTDRLTVGASASGHSTQGKETYDAPSTTRYDFHSEGLSGESLFAKYAFMGGQSAPMALTGELTLTSDSDINPTHHGHNALAARLTAGWDCGQGIRSYAGIHASVPDKANYARAAGVTIGSWIPVSDAVTLTPAFDAIHYEASSDNTSYNSYGLTLGALVDVGTNTYVRPGIGYTRDTGNASANGHFRSGELKVESASVELYHLF